MSAPPVPPRSLSVSIVVYNPDVSVVEQTVRSLRHALDQASASGVLGDARVHLIDNGTPEPARLDQAVAGALGSRWHGGLTLRRGHGNIGYGRGHNLAIGSTTADYHLVLNPDVVLDRMALERAIEFLEANTDVGLLAPSVRGPSGETEYLCKRFPSLFVLLLRGFAPGPIRAPFRAALDRYEMRDRIGDTVVKDVPIASGCFMLLRHGGHPAVPGFSERYFLYFEDFDLSVRLSRVSRIAYVPSVRITHFGGGAARKGVRHQALFLRSALTFFLQHGWRVV